MSVYTSPDLSSGSCKPHVIFAREIVCVFWLFFHFFSCKQPDRIYNQTTVRSGFQNCGFFFLLILFIFFFILPFCPVLTSCRDIYRKCNRCFQASCRHYVPPGRGIQCQHKSLCHVVELGLASRRVQGLRVVHIANARGPVHTGSGHRDPYPQQCHIPRGRLAFLCGR